MISMVDLFENLREVNSLFICLLVTSLVLPIVAKYENPCNVAETLPYNLTITEIDGEGTELLKTTPGDFVWTLDFLIEPQKVLLPFFNLTAYGNKILVFYTLSLTRALDLEYIKRTWNIEWKTVYIKLTCKSNMYTKPLTHNMMINILEKNEFSPRFHTSSFAVQVRENAYIGTQVIRLSEWATDEDVTFLEQEIKGFNVSSLESGPGIYLNDYMHITNYLMGTLVTKKKLDFELFTSLRGIVVVQDNGGLRGKANLTIDILDDDDTPPVFLFPPCEGSCPASYFVNVPDDHRGIIPNIEPGPIQARDGDTTANSILYTITKGPTGYAEFISIDVKNAEVMVIKPLKVFHLKSLTLTVQAEEVSSLNQHTTVTLQVNSMDAILYRQKIDGAKEKGQNTGDEKGGSESRGAGNKGGRVAGEGDRGGAGTVGGGGTGDLWGQYLMGGGDDDNQKDLTRARMENVGHASKSWSLEVILSLGVLAALIWDQTYRL
ncbi:protocadherin beta-14-like isoform X1 [Biomphalaria glabrata]|uniref:Protocadherin beta-14-like isoform X1 n=1 Tax=Biomphalaria glabrata TaxID=6526 RepID=A0A9W2ZJX8_BIOGL|nr:protocadherin beta-14-like isoform X1 [Biomphalaria glabrata]